MAVSRILGQVPSGLATGARLDYGAGFAADSLSVI
jgi:hypothetical protein